MHTYIFNVYGYIYTHIFKISMLVSKKITDENNHTFILPITLVTFNTSKSTMTQV